MMQRQQVQGCHDSTIDINKGVRLVDRLEELGLVKRCAVPEDRRIWRLRITPAPILRKIELFRVELHELMTMEIDPWFLDAMVIGLHQMKESLNSSRRLAKASREERPNIKA
jgi:DNA-binding MarR family transcriptional regulator